MAQTVETAELRRRVESILERRREVNPQGVPDPSADITLLDCDGPAGAKPGYVIYHTYRTMYVTPNEDMIKRLRAGR